jgi:GNAT superfamily N-acetyltransferase
LSRRVWVRPVDNPSAVVRRALVLLRNEGLRGLLGGVGRLLGTAGHSIYREGHFRIYELRVQDAVSVAMLPPVDALSLKVIESREDALRLAREGYENVLDVAPGTGHWLDSGAVAACAFVEKAFASIDWMVLCDSAKAAIDGIPYRVDFSRGEACTAGAFTIPEFRGKGIGTFRLSIQMRYLHARGYRVCRCMIGVDNVASQRCVEKYGAQFTALAHWRRVLWWEKWKETRMPRGTS